MKNNMDNKKKVKRIINIFSAAWWTVLLLIVIFLRTTTEIPGILLYGCMGACYVAGLLALQKAMEGGKLKDALEEVNRECEEEEENKPASEEKPDFFSLAVIALFAFIYSICTLGEIGQTVIKNLSEGSTIKDMLPQCISALTLLICCVFIAIILFNVAKKRIFDRRNSICIYGVGATVIFGKILQNWLYDNAALTESDTTVYYSLLGILIIFFGRLFDIAVKMKNEQDLTI